MFPILWIFCSFCSSTAATSSLFRSSELLNRDHDWLIEYVKVIPLDDGHEQQDKNHRSYLIYRQNSTDSRSSFVIDLRLNVHFDSHIPIEYDNGEQTLSKNNCSFYSGSVRHWGQSKSMVALSMCSGLAGLIHHTQYGYDYFLEPMLTNDNQSHILIYRGQNSLNTSDIWSCKVNSSMHPKSKNRFSSVKRQRRSIIRERFIETLLVADASVSEFFAHSHVTELYLLTMMNMVNNIYAHVSLGYPVEIVLTRIIMLTNQSDFQMATRAQETLQRFCTWQEQLKKGAKNNRTIHHDVAVFLTRKSLCHENSSCSTIGLAHMAGMCMVNRSCNINQDIGLISAYTVAHEIGHNLGMHHDGDKGHCLSASHGDTIMVPSYNRVPMNMWSKCSRDNLTDFFDQGWATCLNNRPTIARSFDDVLPGIIFDLDEQCRLAIGPHSTACFLGDERPIDICAQMMCTRIHQSRSICISTLTNQPADGTLCGTNKWCLQGRCTPMNYRAETPSIHGGWSPWTLWSSCSHACGLGVEYQYRTCTNPKPDFGGKHCLGTRKRYRTCHIASCKKVTSTHADETHLNCDELNRKSNGTQWRTVSWLTPVPCMMFCTPVLSSSSMDNETLLNSNFTMNGDEVGKIESIKVRDGTQCIIDDQKNEHLLDSRGMCIAGQCQKLGCDNQLYSNAIEDECGICNGNRNHCQQIHKVLQYQRQESTPSGSYVRIANLSKGIATFQIEKPTQSSSFLAIKVKDRYYLNGNRSITESSQFQIGQTHFWYRRGNKQETLEGRGHALSDDVDVMLLILNTELIKIKFMSWQLTNKSKIVNSNYYQWEWENDTTDDCSCQHRHPQCTFLSEDNETIVVSDHLCDAKLKPRSVKCPINCSNQSPSSPRWQIGQWRACEGRCWPQEAIQRRSLLCVRTLADNRTHVIPTSLCLQLIPSIPMSVRQCPQNMSLTFPQCNGLKTYHYWNTSEWSGNCSSSNPCAMQWREVTCVSQDSNSICNADEKFKPVQHRPCNTTCGEWHVSHWSADCSGSCENATVIRQVWCSSSICNEELRPSSIRRCVLPSCMNASIYTTTTTLLPSTALITQTSKQSQSVDIRSRIFVTSATKTTKITTVSKANIAKTSSTKLSTARSTSSTTTPTKKTSLVTKGKTTVHQTKTTKSKTG